MIRYRKKAIEVEAVRWNGRFFDLAGATMPRWLHDALERLVILRVHTALNIVTPKGCKTASEGDWIVRDESGEIYPVTAGLFHRHYEGAES